MLELSNIGKHYDVAGRKFSVLSGIDLRLKSRNFGAIVGRSGCGKTTLLRLMTGLILGDTGEIPHDGQAPKIGVVFQEARLMPWLDVFGNIAFALKNCVEHCIIEKRVSQILEVTGLSGFRHASPSQLSGGMAQRVALPRALVMEPDLLLMDEPAALDAFTGPSMQNELVALWQARKTNNCFCDSRC